MTAHNVYATLAEFKAYFTARGGSAATDAADDAVIDQLLEQASRHLDSKTARFYYPRIETRYYNIPGQPDSYERELWLDADLLAIISFLNGDGTSIASTEYNLLPRNESPKYEIAMKQISNIVWSLDSNGDWEHVIAVSGIWGFHNRYADAWLTGTTLSEDLDTRETEWDVASAALFAAGQTIKVDNEICNISSTATGKLNVLSRGDNGSTAATHLTGATIYIWRPMEEVRSAVCEIANTAYRRRFGQATSGMEQITGAGVVLSPRDIPALAAEFIATFQRRVYT
jgi:hypothetical protein